MPWNAGLTKLQRILAALYPDVQRAKEAVKKAGLPSGRIQSDPAAESNWFNILEEADRQGLHMVSALVAVACDDFPNRCDELTEAYNEYLELAGTVLSQPSLPVLPGTAKETKQPPFKATPDGTPAEPKPRPGGVRLFQRPSRVVVQRKWLVAVIAAVLLVILGILGSTVLRNYLQERQTPTYWIDRFRNVESPDLRMDALSRIVALTGEHQTAQNLFFDGLTHAERVRMFELSDPKGLQQELTVVVKAIYTRLDYTPENHEVLKTIAATLSLIEEPRDDAIKDLQIEIAHWCDAQDFYADGQYNRAIEAYDVAIAVNKTNAAAFWDRAVAHAAQGTSRAALADYRRVIALDEARQDPVIRMIEQDPDAFTYLGLHRSSFPDLAGFFPTLTPTPTPTFTPTPTPSPTPTFTPTPIPSPTPTFTPTPIPSPTPTPTFTATPAFSFTWDTQTTCSNIENRVNNLSSVEVQVTGRIVAKPDDGAEKTIAQVPPLDQNCPRGLWCGPLEDIHNHYTNFHGVVWGTTWVHYQGVEVGSKSFGPTSLDCNE